MSNFVKLFQPRFVEAVRNGTKTQTIRKTPKRMPRPGDTLSLRTWTGNPYRSKQEILDRAVVTEVNRIRFWIGIDGNFQGSINGKHLHPIALDVLAVFDGFENWLAMKKWFEANHGLPFSGILIRWRLV